MGAPVYKQTMYVDSAASLPVTADDGQLAFLLDTQSTVTYSVAAAAWAPLGRQMVFKSAVSVNGKNTGNTMVYTLPASPLYFYPTGIIVRAVSVSGSGTAPVMTVGSNAANYNNVATSSLVNTLLGTLDVNNGSPMMATFSPGLVGGTQIYAKVTTGALLYTNYTVKLDILGFYDSTAP
jgi:hypothetical protein